MVKLNSKSNILTDCTELDVDDVIGGELQMCVHESEVAIEAVACTAPMADTQSRSVSVSALRRQDCVAANLSPQP
jgi:hypothetical protein